MTRSGNILLIVLLVLGMDMGLRAQNVPLAGARRAEVLTAIAAAQQPKAGTTLHYTFVQTKHSPLLAKDAVSKGTLRLSGDCSMRWQYTEPNAFTLAVEGDSIYTIIDGKRNPLSGAGGRMARGMAQLMMQMTAGASLTDEKLFETVLTEEGDVYRAVMTPKRRDMKRMMQQVVLTFDRKSLRIKSVRLVEKEDSYTHIDFTLL